MANSPMIGVILRGTVRSTPVSDTEPVVVSVNEFEGEIRALEATAAMIARESAIADSVRKDYLKKIKAASDELVELVKQRKITPHEGALSAYSLRNTIMQIVRSDLTSFGLAASRDIKPDAGRPLAFYLDKNAKELFGVPFKDLSKAQHEAVYMRLISRAGASNTKVSGNVKIYGMAARALLIFSLTVAVYNVVEADDKQRQVAKEGSTFVAGAAGGAAAGVGVTLLVSNPAGWVVGLVGLIGAALSGLGASEAFDYFWPQKTRR